MADTKASAFTTSTTLTDDDTFPFIDDQDGTPANRQITWGNLKGHVTSLGRVYRATSTQALSDAVDTALQWNAEDTDPDGWHDNATNNTRMTCPSGKAGFYQWFTQARVSVPGAGTIQLSAKLTRAADSSTEIVAFSKVYVGAAAAYFVQLFSQSTEIAVGDYVEIFCTQDTTGAGTLDEASGTRLDSFCEWRRVA